MIKHYFTHTFVPAYTQNVGLKVLACDLIFFICFIKYDLKNTLLGLLEKVGFSSTAQIQYKTRAHAAEQQSD